MRRGGGQANMRREGGEVWHSKVCLPKTGIGVSRSRTSQLAAAVKENGGNGGKWGKWGKMGEDGGKLGEMGENGELLWGV